MQVVLVLGRIKSAAQLITTNQIQYSSMYPPQENRTVQYDYYNYLAPRHLQQVTRARVV